MAKKVETPEETPATTEIAPTPETAVGALVTQPHGGKIWQGRPANPRAGPGRTQSAIRATALMAFDERMGVLEEIADNEEAKETDRIAALRELARIGMGQQVSRREVRQALIQTYAVIRAFESLTAEQADALIATIHPNWEHL